MKTRKTQSRRSLQRLVRRLAKVSDDMRNIGAEMDYYGGWGLMGDRGREMLGAARLAKSWIPHLRKIARIVNGVKRQQVKPPNAEIRDPAQ